MHWQLMILVRPRDWSLTQTTVSIVAAHAGVHWQDRCGDSITLWVCKVSRGISAECQCQPTGFCPLQAGDLRLDPQKLGPPVGQHRLLRAAIRILVCACSINLTKLPCDTSFSCILQPRSPCVDRSAIDPGSPVAVCLFLEWQRKMLVPVLSSAGHL